MQTTQKALLPEALPEVIRNSRLMKKRGFEVFDGLIDASTRMLLLFEAISFSSTARLSFSSIADSEDVRGGTPARCYLGAPGGPAQDALYHSEWMLHFLRQVTGTPLVPTGERGTYSYYARPGHYLALHRDIVTCDLALISCLNDGPRIVNNSGMLCLYPDRIFEPLSAIRASLNRGAVGVQLKPGQSIVIFGGIVPHMLLPVTDQQTRIVSVLCYRVPL